MTLSRTARRLLLPGAVLVAATTFTACDIITELEAVGDQRAVTPGDPITGRVLDPSGTITVTLTPASLPRPEEGANSAGATGCDYDDEKYSCPTDGLPLGTYRVEVTDSDFASEGTKMVTVVVSDVDGYDPEVAADATDPRILHLTGWQPGRKVRVSLTGYDSTTPDAHLVGTPDADGNLDLRVPGTLAAGEYGVAAADGVWDTSKAEGWGGYIGVVV